MVFLKVILLALLLLVLAFAGLGIKMLFKKDAKFTGGSCSLNEGGMSCECGAEEECDKNDIR
ncbi:MAG: hypothetical protein ACEPOZ_04275 [Marinifilaceae bacterium]|jgi:hypothetical protein